MKKQLIGLLAFSLLLACAKNDEKKSPMSAPDIKVDSQQVADAKKAAQAKVDDVLKKLDEAKSKRENTTSVAGDSATSTTTTTTTLVGPEDDGSYLGDMLTLVVPHAANWGWIKFEGRDAKTLFDTLKVKAIIGAGNTVWNPSREKLAKNIACYEQAKKVTPTSPEYTCSLYIDYSAGSVSAIAAEAQEDKSVPPLTKSYEGDHLKMSVPNPGKFAWLELNDQDSKALYNALEADAVALDAAKLLAPTNQKAGPDINCFEKAPKESPEKLEYSCSVYFNFETGAIIPVPKEK